MPNWMDSKQEKEWKHAVDIVKEETDKPKSKFKDRDWGLTMHIFKQIEKSKKKRKKKAECIYELAKIANALDAQGLFAYANMIDEIIYSISERA